MTDEDRCGEWLRAIILSVLVWHEVVNDTFRGDEILVTYCPHTFRRLSMIGRSVTNPLVRNFWKLMDSNTLLYDTKTESLWSQLKGKRRVSSRLESHASVKRNNDVVQIQNRLSVR